MASKVQKAKYREMFKRAGVKGRLHWKSSHPEWRCWDSNDVCMIKNGTVRVHFEALEALEEWLKIEEIPF
jgi:hypothetical protein